MNHPFARELAQMSALIDGLPREALEALHADIVAAGGDPDQGREGMSADQVVRATIVKQMTSSSYDELAFHLNARSKRRGPVGDPSVTSAHRRTPSRGNDRTKPTLAVR